MTDRIKAIDQAVKMLREARDSGKPCAPVRDILPEMDIDAAYAVQEKISAALVKAGNRRTGRKIGLTAKAVQEQLGVDQPDCGVLFASDTVGDGHEIEWGRAPQPRVEAEVALLLKSDIDVALPGVADIVRAVDFVVPAFEIVASRIENWDIKIVDTVADNASFGLYVLGGPARSLDGLDLRACEMVLTRNGETVSEGSGAACLGNPLNAAVWLARKMAELGDPLRAGEVILTGALGPMVAAEPGDEFKAEISGLGSVQCVFGAQ